MTTPKHPRKKATSKPRGKSAAPPTTASQSDHPVAQFVTGLQKRLSKILAVIDDALDSESLKDRAWAVDQLLKRLKIETLIENLGAHFTQKSVKPAVTEEKPPTLHDLEMLSEAALIAEIDRLFQHEGPQDNWEDITQ